MIQITDPTESLVEDARKTASATYNHVATQKGKYEYCFSNTFSTLTEKTVGFNVLVMKPHKEDPSKNRVLRPCFSFFLGGSGKDCLHPCFMLRGMDTYTFVYCFIVAHMADPLDNEIRELAAGIEEIKNEQEYTMARERTHRNSTSPFFSSLFIFTYLSYLGSFEVSTNWSLSLF